MHKTSPSQIARGFDSFQELGREARVHKLFDVFDLEFSILVRSDLDDQTRFVNKRYANGRVCIISGLEGVSSKKMES